LPAKDFSDTNYLVDVNDHIGWCIFLSGYFDCGPFGIARFLQSQRPGGVFIDVGANIGSTSIPVAKLGIPTIGIEASPSVARDIANNLGLNSPISFTILNLAVSSPSHCDADSFVKLFSPPDNCGASSFYESWSGSRSASKIELSRVTTLDSIIEWLRLENILAVKIDIEGAELLALEGFQETMARSRPFVIFEWRPDRVKKAGLPCQDIRQLFPVDYHFYSVRPRLIEKQFQSLWMTSMLTALWKTRSRLASLLKLRSRLSCPLETVQNRT
jgi:FkbM family methyltransferase